MGFNMNSNDKNLAKLKDIFHESLNIEQSLVSELTSMQNTSEWDSLQHMLLILKIEEAFGLKFEVNEIIELNSVERILNKVNSKKAS